MSSEITHDGHDAHDDHDHHGPAKGLMRWVTTTNHKDIGTLYLWLAFTMLLYGGSMAMVIRLELFQPGLQWVEPHFFNQMTTMHGLVMVFGAIMPAFVGLANWLIPMMIGAPDMALPRMNNWSFWILPFAFTMLASTTLMESGAPAFGWTFYAPLSTTFAPDSTDFFIFAVHLMGISSVMGAINIIATVLNMRAPGMTLMKMPLFVWTWLITAYLLIAVMPVLAGAVTMMLTDRHFGTGYSSMVYASASIAILSFMVWAHHMFTTGMPVAGELYFMYATILISVPTGVKVFNWVTTMWKGSMTFETPMLWALGFIVMFTIGGFSGLMLGVAPVDTQYHDTYFVVAHFHYVLVTGALYSIIAAFYYWVPKWTGHMYDEKLGKIHFWWSTIAVNVLFFPQHFVGLAGMPRRIPDYSLQFAEFNMISSIGGFAFGLAQVFFLYIVIKTIKGGEKASDIVWEGATGLEFEHLPSPPPYHSFSEAPSVK